MAFLMNGATASALRKPSVEDMILLLNPHETPVLSTMRKGKKPAGFIHQWPVRTVPAAVTTTVADGTDVTSSDATNQESLKKVLSTRPHQLQRVAFTGNLTAELEKQYGIADLHADDVAQKMQALKWDTESVIVGSQDSAVSSDSHTTRGIGCWLGLTTVSDSLTIDSTVAAASAAKVNLGTDAAVTALTETNIRAVLQGIFEASYAPLNGALAPCTPSMKAHITNSLAILATVSSTTLNLRRFSNESDQGTVGANVTRVVSDFGSIDLVPHVGLPTGSTTTVKYPYMYILDMDMWEFLPVQPLHMEKLPNLGGGPRTLLRTSFFNKCGAPMRNGVIYWTKS